MEDELKPARRKEDQEEGQNRRMNKQKDYPVEGRSIGRMTMKEEDQQEGPSRRLIK